ncbi:hypothetical protein Q9233_000158 [Columba guinea]|nr:hypothetical protein Q9233_000158 [Columba guinea]
MCQSPAAVHCDYFHRKEILTDIGKAVIAIGRLESPTRALVMEAPKGIEINAEAGSLKATCRTELRLESKDGEITLNSAKIKLPNLPQGSSSSAGSRQKIYELCVCPNGRLFLSQAGSSSTCQINTSVCL